MTRMLLLAALALACVLSVSPVFAMAYPPEWGAPSDPAARFAVAAGVVGSFFGILILAALAFDRSKIGPLRFCAAVGLAFIVLGVFAPAFAQGTPAVTPAVVIPYGEYVVAVAQLVGDILVPLLVAVIMGLLGKFYPMVRMLVSEALVERTLRKWFDFGFNATAGAVKDNTVTVPVGVDIVANALQRAVNRADVNAVSKWTMDQAGGPEEVANKLFRMLKLDAGATASDIVKPALASLPFVAKAA